jgi:hypothetical protein
LDDGCLTSQDDRDHRERRLALLVGRLPERLQGMVNRLRQPSARWARIPAGIFLILGSLLAILPVFGMWMLPLGLILLSEDIALLRSLTNKWLQWIERWRPHWMGLPRAARPSRSKSEQD